MVELDVVRSSGLSLRREILDLVALSGRTLGFEPSLDLVGPIDTVVPSREANHLLAVLREALSNVAHHAGASRVDVTIQADANLLLEVVDDGRGIETAPNKRGNCLRNLARRAEELGGGASVTPGTDRGTKLQWIVPLPTGSSRPSTG